MQLTSDELGELGESEFKKLAARGRFLAHKVDRDRSGWDFVVEINPSPSTKQSFDARPPPASIYVQVKATYNSKNPKVKLRLSSAEMLAKRPNASFIVAIVYNRNDHDDFKIYAVELIGERLAKILSTLRQRQASGSKEINHSYIDVPLKSFDLLSNSDGDSLGEKFRDTYENGEDHYISEKRSQLSSLGFGPFRYQGTLTVNDVSPLEVTDLLLGQRDFVGTIGNLKEIRFGIELPSDHLPAGEGVIRITPHPICKCRMIVRAKSGRKKLVFNGEFYQVSIPGPTYILSKSKFDFGFFSVFRIDRKFSLQSSLDAESDACFSTREYMSFIELSEMMITSDTDWKVFLSNGSRNITWSMGRSSYDESESKDAILLFKITHKVASELGIQDLSIPVRDIFLNQKKIYMAGIFGMKSELAGRLEYQSTTLPSTSPQRRILSGYFDLGDSRVAFSSDVQMVAKSSTIPSSWSTGKYSPVEIDIIGKTSSDFRSFIDGCLERSGCDESLVGEEDAKLLQESAGSIEPF